eukprot:10394924-Prorocentrum_lima.AAC.1
MDMLTGDLRFFNVRKARLGTHGICGLAYPGKMWKRNGGKLYCCLKWGALQEEALRFTYKTPVRRWYAHM